MALSISVTERAPGFKEFHFCLSYCTGATVGWDSAVGIATCFGLDGLGDRIPMEDIFSAPIQTVPETHPTSSTMGTGFLSCG
jgi:hypothetical protein